jgi:hypothetical protein
VAFAYLARERRRTILILRPTFERLARLFLDEQTISQTQQLAKLGFTLGS